MSNYSAGSGTRTADPHPKLRLAALTAVVLGVLLLAAAAFVLSYAGIHQLALRAGLSTSLARLYPGIFDAMLVVAGAAALSLRSAGWWARVYAWFALLLLFVAVAVADAFHATRVALPIQPTRATVAVTPWVLLLLAFGLWLAMLRHFRKTRTASQDQPAAGTGTAGDREASPADAGGQAGGEPGQAAQESADRSAVTWASSGVNVLPRPRPGPDTLLGPREGTPPAMAPAGPDAGAAAEDYQGQHDLDTGHYADPVSYGEETGYVHPDSYQGDYPEQASYPGAYPGHDYPGGYPGHAGYPGGYPAQPDYTRHDEDPGTGAGSWFDPSVDAGAADPAEPEPAPVAAPVPALTRPAASAEARPAGADPAETEQAGTGPTGTGPTGTGPAGAQPAGAQAGEAHAASAPPSEAPAAGTLPAEAPSAEGQQAAAGAQPAGPAAAGAPSTSAQPAAQAARQPTNGTGQDSEPTAPPPGDTTLERLRSTPARPQDES